LEYNTYKDSCIEIGIEATTQRHVTELISELSALGIINAVDRSKGRHGRTKEVTLSVNEKTAWDVLMEDERLSYLKVLKTKEKPLIEFC